MKKSIFKITTLLLLLCAAMCSVLGIAACSSSDEEETAAEPIVGTWVATCTNTNYTNYRVGYYYVKVTSTTSSTVIGVKVTSAFKRNDESTYTFRERVSMGFSKVTSGSDGDYSGGLDLSGYDTNGTHTCIITMTGDDTFTLKEYYTDTAIYTYTFERTTMTLDEWKASPTGSAS